MKIAGARVSNHSTPAVLLVRKPVCVVVASYAFSLQRVGGAPDSKLNAYLTSPQLEPSHLEVHVPSTFIV